MTNTTPILRKIDTPIEVNDPARPGRKHTVTVAEAILEAIAQGATHETAARYTGISPATLSTWLTRGANEIVRMAQNDQDTPKTLELPYVNLWVQLATTEATTEVELTGHIKRAAKKDWKAAEKLLAKRYGGVWAEKPAANITITGMSAVPSHQAIAQLQADLQARREIGAVDVREVE